MSFRVLAVSEDDRRFASRKWRLSLLALALVWATFLLLELVHAFAPDLARITPDQALDFSVWIVGLYMAGNVGDTVAEGLKT